jgi:hypothetical protein
VLEQFVKVLGRKPFVDVSSVLVDFLQQSILSTMPIGDVHKMVDGWKRAAQARYLAAAMRASEIGGTGGVPTADDLEDWHLPSKVNGQRRPELGVDALGKEMYYAIMGTYRADVLHTVPMLIGP